jgi:hypothetical protein
VANAASEEYTASKKENRKLPNFLHSIRVQAGKLFMFVIVFKKIFQNFKTI